MNKKKNLKIILSIVFGLLLLYVIFYLKNSIEVSEYLNPEVLATHYNNQNFVASETCLECHEEIYNSHLKTAHYNTSQLSESEFIKGSFEKGYNELNLKGVQFKMIEENNQFYQYSKAKFGDTIAIKSKIDLVIGSGVKGQSYLTWRDDELLQLQVSYFQPTGSWVNSPNFPNHFTNRKVDDNCLKCHVTFATHNNNDNQYIKEKMLLGVDCQRCHGALEKHVKYQRENPNAENGSFVDTYNDYSRQQRLDACAVCHSGLQAQQLKGNPFSFVSGDTLALYSKNYKNYNINLKLDVHGNQIGLLSQSECFVNSPQMNCVTCHDPHVNQRGNLGVFNAKCVSCHSKNIVFNDTGHTLSQNCISCHMPLVSSEVMKLKLEEEINEIPVYIRTHLIGVYE
ncbi:multiheme c-type cytochrome [Maribacter sp. Asnod1-A12]|uniref:multiheme c-type cytochrome n=1 Tax=Maribacter sp. Asnod1-A12 TaxID=3160576 RepID=UPI00386565F9